MKAEKRRRVNLRANDDTWRRFRVLCLELGTDVEQRLGELVTSDLRSSSSRKTRAAKRREVNARELRKAIREAEAAPASSKHTRGGGKVDA